MDAFIYLNALADTFIQSIHKHHALSTELQEHVYEVYTIFNLKAYIQIHYILHFCIQPMHLSKATSSAFKVYILLVPVFLRESNL